MKGRNVDEDRRMKNERISLQICTRDRHTEILALLESLRHQTFTSWDLVLCDGSKFPQGHPMQGQPNLFVNTKFGRDMITRLKLEGHGVQILVDDGAGVCEARNKCIMEDLWQNELICRIDDDSICAEDYLEKLYNIIIKDEKIGGVSGIVPIFGDPGMERNINIVGPVMSRIDFNDEGDITYLGDDAGSPFNENKILPTHHLRSSFMFRRSAALKAGMFPLGLGPTGFREESKFSVRLLMLGYKLFVDTSAICWHNVCPSGGVRAPDYGQKVQFGDLQFRKWFKHMVKIGKITKEMFDCSKW